MKKKHKIIIGTLLTVTITLVGYFLTRQYNPFYKRIEYYENETPNYQKINIDDQIDNTVVNSFTVRGFTYIELSDSNKIVLEPARNGSYENNFIGDFLKEGDLLKKKSKSDTIIIERQQKRYYFIKGKIINE